MTDSPTIDSFATVLVHGEISDEEVNSGDHNLHMAIIQEPLKVIIHKQLGVLINSFLLF